MPGRSPPGLGRPSPLEMSPKPGRPKPESMLPKLGRLLIPGETPGREPNEGEPTLGRETEGRLISGLEPALKSGRLLIPIEGREIDGLDPGSVAGRLLTLGSEGRLDGIEMLGREAPPPLGREILGLGRDAPPPLGRDTLGDGRDIPPPGRDPPPIPIDGLAPPPPPPPRPPPPRPCPQASGTSTKPDTPISRMPKAIEFTRRFISLTRFSLACGELWPLSVSWTSSNVENAGREGKAATSRRTPKSCNGPPITCWGPAVGGRS